MRWDEEIPGSVVTALHMDEAPPGRNFRIAMDAVPLALDLFIGQDRIAVGRERGPGHHFPAVPGSKGSWLRSPRGMVSGNHEGGSSFQIGDPEADAIHHDAVVGREGTVRDQFGGKDPALGLRKWKLLSSQGGEGREGYCFRSVRGDEWIHEVAPVHKEWRNTQVFSCALAGLRLFEANAR